MTKRNENRKGYKKTKVGWIPKEWECTSLDKIGQWKGGGTPSKENNEFWKNGTISWVSSQDVKEPVLRKTKYKITEQAVRRSTTNIIPEGSIILVNRSGILRHTFPVATTIFPVAINQDIKAVLPDANTHTEYLFNILQCYGKDILKKCSKTGTTVESIEFDWLKSYPIPLPPLPEQKKIAEILSIWDKAIDQVRELIEAKKKLKKGLIQQLLTGRIRFPGFGKSVKKTGDLPKGWRKLKMKELLDIRRGASPRPINDPKWFSKSGRGWIRIADVTKSNNYLNKTTQYLSREGVSKSVVVEPGDLILSICATIGVPIIVNVPACIHDGFVVFKNISESLDKYFLYYFLLSIENVLSGKGQPGAQKNINTSIVCNLRIEIPNIREQKKIICVLKVVDHEIEFYQKREIKLRNQKNGLMQKLLTGEVRMRI